jgi:hypothetical protein
MADRVSASISLGGTLALFQYHKLAEIIAREALMSNWDGTPFDPARRNVGEQLTLYAHEVAWGRFEELEAWCATEKLAFVRWSGACVGQWGAQRTVFMGHSDPISYATDEEDYVVVNKATLEKLGSVLAINAYFDRAEFKLPPLVVEGDLGSASRK